MAPYKFLKAIHQNETITKFGDGTSSRDYTYVDDIVDGLVRASTASLAEPSTVYNLGNTQTVDLNTFIRTCEGVVGKTAVVRALDHQPGDVSHTHANIKKAMKDLQYKPNVSIVDGLQKMYDWMVSTALL